MAQLEAIVNCLSNTSVLVNPERTTIETRFEATYKRQLEQQSKEIDELKGVLNEYSNV